MDSLWGNGRQRPEGYKIDQQAIDAFDEGFKEGVAAMANADVYRTARCVRADEFRKMFGGDDG